MSKIKAATMDAQNRKKLSLLKSWENSYLSVESEKKNANSVQEALQEWSLSLAVLSAPLQLLIRYLHFWISHYLITDVLEGLAGDSCTLIHNSSWVKLAAKGMISSVIYGAGGMGPMIRLFPGTIFFSVTCRLLICSAACEVGIRVTFWQFTHHQLSLICGWLFRLWINWAII